MAGVVTLNLIDSPPTLDEDRGLPLRGSRSYLVKLTGADLRGSEADIVRALQGVDENDGALGVAFTPGGIDWMGKSVETIYSRMICVSRRAIIVDIGVVRVDCQFRYIDTSLNNALNIMPTTGLKTATTDTMPDGVTRITVKHQGLVQAAEVSALLMDDGFRVEIIKTTTTPREIAKDWLGHTNSSPWKSGAAGTWLCTAADYVPISQGTGSYSRWSITFEFRYDARGWYPEASWRDLNTGRAPDQLTTTTDMNAEAGRKKIVEFYKPRDFGVDP